MNRLLALLLTLHLRAGDWADARLHARDILIGGGGVDAHDHLPLLHAVASAKMDRDNTARGLGAGERGEQRDRNQGEMTHGCSLGKEGRCGDEEV